MADPMWSGGAQQLADYFPWVWNMMSPPSGWMCEPFLPTDPPRNPTAFNASVEMITNTPYVGAFYGYFIDRYCVYYAEQWDANPPGTSSSTPVIPTLPAGEGSSEFDPYSNYNLHAHLDTGFGAVESELGSDPNATIHEKLDDIIATLADITATLTGGVPATNYTDRTALILSALYYIAAQPIAITMQGVTPAELAEAVSDITAYVDTDNDGQSLALQNHIDPLLEAIHTHAEAADTQATAANTKLGTYASGSVAEDLGDIHEDIAAIEPGGGGGPVGYPGPAGVTAGTPVEWDAAAEITATMDGCFVSISSMPAGTGKHTVNGKNSWQHAGWLCFLASDGYADEMQWLNLEDAVYTPKRIEAPAGVLLFPRLNSSGTLTPWTRNV